MSLPALSASSGCTVGYEGKVSDHFDGERFFTPWASPTNGFGAFVRWQWTRDPEPWPESVENLYHDKPPKRAGGVRVAWVGHATVLLQIDGYNILTDPHWSERASPVSWAGPKRIRPPGIAFEDLPPIDLVLVSHNHYDHLDLETLARLDGAHGPVIVTPLGNGELIRGSAPGSTIRELDWGENTRFQDLTITASPAQHWSSRAGVDRNQALWSAFVMTGPSANIYYGGDTGYGPHLRETGRSFRAFDLAVLPIGAYEPRWFMSFQHMDPAEAVNAHLNLNARQSLAVHFETFRLTDEAFEEPRAELLEALDQASIPRHGFRALQVGEAWTVA
ncbi:MAG: MBL fold metallo-hydrolase [Geminicoccaceae bacterium]